VVSDKMAKTAVVRVMLIAKHPKYGRMVKKYQKFKAHDEKKVSKVGDTVRIRETRPLSKDKHFMVAEVIKKVAIPKIELKEETK